MKIIIGLLCIFLTSCSTKHAGKFHPEFAANACPISKSVCGGNVEGLELRYRVKKMNNNEYILEGYAKWSQKKADMSAIYNEVDDLTFRFVFMENNLVAHEELIRLWGGENDKLTFKRNFISDRYIDAVNISEWDGTVTSQ